MGAFPGLGAESCFLTIGDANGAPRSSARGRREPLSHRTSANEEQNEDQRGRGLRGGEQDHNKGFGKQNLPDPSLGSHH